MVAPRSPTRPIPQTCGASGAPLSASTTPSKGERIAAFRCPFGRTLHRRSRALVPLPTWMNAGRTMAATCALAILPALSIAPALAIVPALAVVPALADGPVVTSVDPPRGSSVSETLLTLAGEGFAPGARVSLLNGGPFF